MSEPISASRLHLVETWQEADEFTRWLGQRRPWLAIDTETTGLDWWRGQLRMIQIGDQMDGWAMPAKWWGGLAKQAIERYEGQIVMQNAKFDVHWLREYGIVVPRHRLHDTRVMAHLVNNLLPTGLKFQAGLRVDDSADQLEHELKVGVQKNGWDWATVPLDYPPYWHYSAMDVILTARLAEVLWPQVQSYRSLYDVEMTTQQILIDMEARGIRVDREYCTRTLEPMKARIAQLEEWMCGAYNIDNPGSDQQVAERMAADGVVFTKFTETGKPSMEKEALAGIEHPLAVGTVELRHLQKIAATYLENFLDMADADGVLHPSINLLGAKTGRMSVSAPSLQNLERSTLVRGAFIPRDGHVLLLADYDQIEMRLMAHYANVQSMIDAALAGGNLHMASARTIYHIAADQVVPKKQYHTTKNAGFAKIYGAGIGTFARTAGISQEEAAAFMAAYDGQFPEVGSFMDAVIRVARQRSAGGDEPHIFTAYGRRLACAPKREYKLVNYLIQGTAADVLKHKMVSCDAAGLLDHMVLPVHDEFVLDVPLEQVDELEPALLEGMAERQRFRAPLTASSERLTRWGEKYSDY